MVARVESNSSHRMEDCEACEGLFGTKDDHRKATEGYWIPLVGLGFIVGLLLYALIWGGR